MDTFKRIVSMVVVFTVVVAGMLAVSTQPVSAAAGEQIENTKTVTKITTKTTNKSVKMRDKAKSSKVTSKTVTKTTTTTKKTTEKKVVVKKTVKTVIKTTYTRGSKIKKIKNTVTTTTKTTTTTYKAKEKLSAEEEAAAVADIVKAVPENLMDAFTAVGFKVTIDPQLATAGHFSTAKRGIQLKTANSGHLLHEMGHFLSCLKNKADETAEFAAIYKKEKDAYVGSNKAYIISTDDEYFAESYRDYVERPAQLKKDRPETYAYINKLATSITQEDIERTINTYGL